MKLQQAIAKAFARNIMESVRLDFSLSIWAKRAPRDVEGTKYDIKEHQKCQEIYKKCWGNYG